MITLKFTRPDLSASKYFDEQYINSWYFVINSLINKHSFKISDYLISPQIAVITFDNITTKQDISLVNSRVVLLYNDFFESYRNIIISEKVSNLIYTQLPKKLYKLFQTNFEVYKHNRQLSFLDTQESDIKNEIKYGIRYCQ